MKKNNPVDKSDPLLSFLNERPGTGRKYILKTALPYGENANERLVEVAEIRGNRLKFVEVETGEVHWIEFVVWYSNRQGDEEE